MHPFFIEFSKQRSAMGGLICVFLIALIGLSAPLLAPHSPIEQFRDFVRLPPIWDSQGSLDFVLGTDANGRDILSRLIFGARISLFIGLAVMLFSCLIGTFLGLLAALGGTFLDVVISRCTDILMAVPTTVLAILIIAALGPNLFHTIAAITLVYLPRFVRLMRAIALEECQKDYVMAARLMGASKWRLMFRTILPNCLGPLIVQAALGTSDAILEAAALGFLGLGTQPPTPEWGTMLADSREFLRLSPWMATLPGLAIFVTVFSLNLMADGLRDSLDPKSWTRR